MGGHDYPEPHWDEGRPKNAVLVPLPEKPDPFIPREGFRDATKKFVRTHDSGILEIAGEMGQGKSSAMTLLLHDIRDKAKGDPTQQPIFHFIGEGDAPAESGHPTHVARELIKQIEAKHDFTIPTDWLTKYPGPIQLLQHLLKTFLALRMEEKDEREVLYLEAADQTQGDHPRDLIPRIFARLPARIYCVITTRHFREAWLGSRTVITVSTDFETVDDRKDCRKLVSEWNQRFRLGLPSTFVRRLFPKARPSPFMFTVHSWLEMLRRNDPQEAALCAKCRTDSGVWLDPPKRRIEDELDRLVFRAERLPQPVAQEQVLETLRLCAVAAEALTPAMLDALGLNRPYQEPVLRLAANFFHDRPTVESPWRYRVQGYARCILEKVRREPLHRLFAVACAERWQRNQHSSAISSRGPQHYALSYLPGHLRDAGDYQRLFALARKEAFLEAQENLDPALPLRTLSLSMEAAVTAKCPVEQAEFCIAQSTRLEAAKREMPVTVFERTKNSHRALQRAEQLWEGSLRALVVLNLILHLDRNGKSDEAEAVARQFSRQSLPPLDIDEQRAAKALIDNLPSRDIAESLASHFQQRSAKTPETTLTTVEVAARLDAELKSALSIKGDSLRAKKLSILAPGLCHANDLRAAARFLKALEAAATFPDDLSTFSHEKPLEALPSDLAKATGADFPARLDQIVDGICRLKARDVRAKCLCAVAPVIAEAKDARAFARLDQAVALACKPSDVVAEALQALAAAVAQAIDSRAVARLDETLHAASATQGAKVIAVLAPAIAQCSDARATARLDETLAVLLRIEDPVAAEQLGLEKIARVLSGDVDRVNALCGLARP
ncbi:MAG: hypothetical protein ABIZ56_06620 [Chthoniobacteraceae bacterium]